jgi:alkanesulfonate monooxygenase
MMSERLVPTLLRVFTTCPASSTVEQRLYQQRVIDVARWSEAYGYTGILVYTDNSLLDPWLVAGIILQHTHRLCPLVAVQPLYMHPYAVAKMVTSLGYLYGRCLGLNMVAGGFTNDFLALHDTTPHDQRYTRLTEYTLIIRALLAQASAVSFAGEFYRVDRLKLAPPLPPELFPDFFVSGSSAQGLVAAHAVGATAICYPPPAGVDTADIPSGTIDVGARVGIIARADADKAWDIARKRFPEDRKGQITHQLAMKISDSAWHKQLSRIPGEIPDSPYWLVPFQNYKTFCPYLVGSYARVAQELARYISLGYKTFILDIPPDEEELHHTTVIFHQALECLPT